MEDSANRRHFLTTSAVAALTLPAWIAACSSDGKGAVDGMDAAAKKKEQEANDVGLFNKGIALEQGAINVYKIAATLPFIAEDKAVLAVAGEFMGQHGEHRDALIKWIGTLGGKADDPASAPTPEIPAAITNEALTPEERKRAVLEFARQLEKQAADAYFKLVTQNLLTDFGRRKAMEILPVEAQHVAIYDLVLGREKPVNAAFFPSQT